MAEADRERWDRNYREGQHTQGLAPAWLDELALPATGRALDIAAGAGRVACSLAARGLRVVATDISPEGLRLCAKRAQAQGTPIETLAIDLEIEALPEGPFQVITCFDYLQRDLFAPMISRLAPGGTLVCQIRTIRNLERHAKPSRRFLLEPGELRELCTGLEVVFWDEDWLDDQAYARIAARRD